MSSRSVRPGIGASSALAWLRRWLIGGLAAAVMGVVLGALGLLFGTRRGREPARLRRWLVGSLAVTGIGAALIVVGLLVDAKRTLHAYLAAYAFVLSLALGALLFLATIHAMNAGWPVALRRLVEVMVSVFPLLAILLVPVLVGMKELYPWLTPESFSDTHTRELVEHRLAYLNTPFFIVRAAIYFACWIAVALLLRAWSLRQDVDPSPELKLHMKRLSAGALPALGITLTFASFDWLMSLTPDWYTTMFGVYFFAGGFVGALALLTLVAMGVERRGLLSPLKPSHYYALGRLMLAFVIFWAYIAYFQFFLIWIGNRPGEATWYLERMTAGWGIASVLLALGHFGVPFLLLLPYALKWRRAPLAVIAGWLLLMHYFDSCWLVLPALKAGPRWSWYELAPLLAIGGLTLAFALWRAAAHPLVPEGDPRLAEAFAYESR
jgi:hypothetical protein